MDDSKRRKIVITLGLIVTVLSPAFYFIGDRNKGSLATAAVLTLGGLSVLISGLRIPKGKSQSARND